MSVASECLGLVKTGGLADVVAALPGALAGCGWQMRVLIPAYRGLAATLRSATSIWQSDLFGGAARVLSGRAAGLDLLLLEAPHLFDRAGGPYGDAAGDHPDNPERFAALCRAAAEIAKGRSSDGWMPDILHAHDWQAALAPAYLRYEGVAVPSVLTIHNIAFQGIMPASRRAAVNLPARHFTAGGYEYWGDISALKAGLVTADRITTVSPTYARELTRPEYGMGLHGVIANRAADLTGILNGVDTRVWDPGNDPAIIPYSARHPGKKAQNRAALLVEFGLGEVAGPLAILVSRLTEQKGIDLVIETLPDFLDGGGGFIVLGSGDAALEAALTALAGRFPDRMGLRIGYDEALSHRIFAGGDAVLVPSRFEPCGLTQMYGLRYGAVPLVAMTGGLADSVIGASPASLRAGVATGIQFHPVEAPSLADALTMLLRLHADKPTWARLRRNAMHAKVGWEAASGEYASLYESLGR